MPISVKQEPKYNIAEDGILNRATGKRIPENEPVFIFRASDKHALAALQHYMTLVQDPHHREVIQARCDHFEKYAKENAIHMKEPDTQTNIDLSN